MPDLSVKYENPAVVGPGMHALIVGVSEYMYLPGAEEPPENKTWNFNKLTSAALSAYKIYEWLDGHKGALRLPVKSIRLLLAPSLVEKNAEPALQTLNAVVPTWDAFKSAAWAWQEAAGKEPQNMTFFYFAGHGLQRGPEEGILLLADVGEPQTTMLLRCVSFGDIRNGMAPAESFPNIAKTQFYFIDACRVRPESLNKFVDPKVPEFWPIELPYADRREAPVLFSTVDGAIALGRKGKPSYFAEGLLLAFERGAEDLDDSSDPPVWPITSMTLKTALDRFYAKNNVGTPVNPGGMVGAPILRNLTEPPDVDVGIYIRPDLLAGNCEVELCDDNGVPVRQFPGCTSMKIELTVKAGIYRLIVKSQRIKDNLYRSKSRPLNQRMPIWPHDLTTWIP